MLLSLEILLVLAGAVVFSACGYLASLALLGRRSAGGPGGSTGVLFDVIVPAHDEEEDIGATVDDLSKLDYPEPRRRVIVVADNCRDRTAAEARRHGAIVWERFDPLRRGKGPALAWAFARSLEEGFADAVVVVDADTCASPNLLRAFAGRIERGAQSLQARYGVRNPDDSWRTVLTTLALALFHEVRSLGRERLGLSAGLRGNGMCFSAGLISRFPHRAESVVEDIEYGLMLGEGGVRVHYVPEVEVLGDMPSDGEASGVQRARWEGGRSLLRRRFAPRLLLRALRERSKVALDLAVDLLLPPLSTLGAWAGVGLVLGAMLLLLGGSPVALAAFLLFLLSLVGLSIYMIRGLLISGLGWRGAQVFLWAPVYLVWRLFKVSGRRREATREWARTPRARRAG